MTTTDDPVMEKLAVEGKGNVFATDTILAHLMASPRTIYPWDIVVQKVSRMLKARRRFGLFRGRVFRFWPLRLFRKAAPKFAAALAHKGTHNDSAGGLYLLFGTPTSYRHAVTVGFDFAGSGKGR